MTPAARWWASRWGPAAAALAGLALPFAFAPFHQRWLAVPALAVLFAVAAVAPRRRALLAAYLFGLGYMAVGVHWIFFSVSRYGGGPAAAALVTPLFILAFALAPVVVCALGRWVAAGRALAATLTLALAWVAVEWVRGWLFTGATWLWLGYAALDTPLAGLAPVLGTLGLSLVMAMAAGALAAALLRPSRRLWIQAVAVAGSFLAVGALLPAAGGWTRPAGEPLSVALLQGNVSQERKWNPEYYGWILGRYQEMTRQNLDADLIVWPEAAIPDWFHALDDELLLPLAREAAESGSVLMVGAPVIEPATGRAYNAVVRLSDPPQFYFKRHLVPFGEYVPLRDALGGALDFVGVPLGDFDAGDSAAPLVARGVPMGVSICYEVTFGDEVAAALPEAELLVNVSNDAWFGDSLAPHQHLEMARMRSLETGRAMLRATNTGISALIDADGEVLARTPMFETATLRGSVTPRTGTTPYVLWTDWPAVAVTFAGLLVAGAACRRPAPSRRPAGDEET